MRYRLSEHPDAETVDTLFGEAKRRSACLGLFTECTVEYDGRASSSLASGDRFVMYKPDGTILVHTDEDRTPQNWQPPGATVQITDHEPLTITAIRMNPEEVITIRCGEVYFASLMRMNDDATLSLRGSESDLRDLLFDQPSLIEAGFRPREREHKTPAGPVDVWGYDDDGQPVILELKRRRSGPDAVSQLRRYVESVDSDVRGILIAPSLTDRAKQLLNEFDLEWRTVEPPEADTSPHRSLDEFGSEQ